MADTANRLNEVLEADRKVIAGFGDNQPTASFATDDAYLKFVSGEKSRLEDRPYLKVTNDGGPAPSTTFDYAHQNNWDCLPTGKENETPDDKYRQFLLATKEKKYDF